MINRVAGRLTGALAPLFLFGLTLMLANPASAQRMQNNFRCDSTEQTEAMTAQIEEAFANISNPGNLQAFIDEKGSVDLPGDLRITKVQGKVYLLTGAGANITLQVDDERAEQGVVMVDSGLAESSVDVVSAIRQFSARPIRMILNTRYAPEHVGGNPLVGRSGSRIDGIGSTVDLQGAEIIARLEAILWMVTDGISECTWPTTTYDYYPLLSLFFNGEGIEIRYMEDAISDTDSIVFFRRSDVISTGDVFNTDRYPPIDLERGGSINGVILALNQILEMTIPAWNQEGGTYVVPGHGRLGDEADVAEYRDMVTIVRDRVQRLINQGMNLEQIQTARPTIDYDGRYDAGISPQDFVEIVYRSLSGEEE